MSHGFVNLEPPPPKTKEVPCGQEPRGRRATLQWRTVSAARIIFRVSQSLEDAFGTFLLGIMLGEQCKIHKSTTGYSTQGA
jgi:hypothetical protein